MNQKNALQTTRSLAIANGATVQRQDFPPFSQVLLFGELLPKIVVKYVVNDDAMSSGMFSGMPSVMLYASLGKGYKGGGFNTSAIEERDRTFGAEQSWNYETGAKTSWLENRITAHVAAFWIDWTNQQVYQLVPQSGSILRNAGRTVSRGVEADVHIRPIENLALTAAFGYTDARFTQYTDQQTRRNTAGMLVSRTIDYAGNRIPFVPGYTANLATEYDIVLANTHENTGSTSPLSMQMVSLRTEVQSIGQTFWREDNTLVQAPYHLLNTRLTLHTSIGKFALWANNLTDTRFTSIQFFFAAEFTVVRTAWRTT